jgi:hypothetical protein
MGIRRFFIMLKRSALVVPFLVFGAQAEIPEPLSVWTEQGVVLTHGASGQWDEMDLLVEPIGVHKKDGIYYLFYTAGFDGCWTVDDRTSHMSVGLATSTDGVNFQKHSGNPVLTPHDFVPVSSHEEGIRSAAIRYVPEENSFVGFFSIESPGGSDSCPLMGSTGQCECNIEVDSYIHTASSADGQAWTIDGAVSGIGNQSGQENYVDDFQYRNGEYYIWSHKAEGGHQHFISRGSGSTNVNLLGDIPALCWGWSQLKSYMHSDNDTVTLIYDPQGGCAPSNDNLYFGTTSFAQPRSVNNERVFHSRGGERTNVFLKDVENGVWRWYYNKSALGESGVIRMRTHPLDGAPVPPAAPIDLVVE